MLLRKELSGIGDPLLLLSVAIGDIPPQTRQCLTQQSTSTSTLSLLISPQIQPQCLRLLGHGPALNICSAEASQLAEDLQEQASALQTHAAGLINDTRLLHRRARTLQHTAKGLPKLAAQEKQSCHAHLGKSSLRDNKMSLNLYSVNEDQGRTSLDIGRRVEQGFMTLSIIEAYRGLHASTWRPPVTTIAILP
jgi:hypothetical protein